MKLLFKVIMLVLLAVLPKAALADEGGYYIRNYNVQATVHKDNVWDITETVDVTFTEYRHGFYRYIPYKYSLYLNFWDENGKEEVKQYEYYADIDDLMCDGWEYTTDREDGNEFIRIGDPYKKVIGDQTFVIHYTYVYPDDRYDENDFLFHTILPVDCNVPIKHFNFKIHFEKELPTDFEENLMVYYGAYGDDKLAENVDVCVKDNTVMGSADGIKPYHTVTLYAELPDGYYEGVKGVSPLVCAVFMGIALLLAILIAYHEITIKHPHITKTIQFYPPDGISSAEVGTIIDDSADLIDLTSLIPWFAGQGYISIREIPDSKGKIGKNAALELTKLKDLPPEAPEYQKKLMKLFFSDGNTVDLSKLGEHPNAMKAAMKELSNVFSGDKVLTNINGKIGWFFLLFIAVIAMFCCGSSIKYFHSSGLMIALIWTVPAFIGLLGKIGAAGESLMKSKLSKAWTFTYRFVLMLLFCGFAWIYIQEADLITTPLLVGTFVSTFLLCEFSGRFIVNSAYRTDMMGKLLGLKEFIETAELQQLQSLQENDEDYYYKVLPYAMVFGLSDKWANQFKNINVSRPKWYNSDAVYATDALFLSNMSRSLDSSAFHYMSAINHDSSSSSSSSGGGGGGFSGGGGGGGGCGSW
ncbi:MAG: DUF2207 domain-containing protein [Prevotellaceae bacterium]|nr:DUF2207 domain-containing protein [Candidatus Minthosoma caballi]